MRPVTTFVVSPTMPPALGPLKELAYNFWWCWHADAVGLFQRIDPALWEEVHHNPVALLSRLSHQRLQGLAERAEFLTAVNEVYSLFRKYMEERGWYASVDARPSQYIAYFCAEFGLHESFPIYSGGLGVLAGDHLKSASDLGLPLVGVGLLYQEGYFRQYLTQSGWQNEQYLEQDFFSGPVTAVTSAEGSPLIISVDLPLGTCYAQIWRVNVGRVALYLLDTNISQNQLSEFRDLTDRLYGGTTDARIMQEIMLGVGGMRALYALGIDPAVCHVNEGHAAFSMLERTKQLRERESLTFEEAWQITRASSVFTTHTPVPAGNEVFDIDLMLRYFPAYVKTLGIRWEEFLALGIADASLPATQFSMTVLGLKGAAYRNGVSELHGHVSRSMWKNVWPHVRLNEVPIGYVTNGVHTPTWVASEIAELYDRYLGLQWRTEPHEPDAWANVDSIPSMELWRVHQRRRERLVLGAREHILHKHEESLTQEQINSIHEHLDPDVLTIGFARRFASYKRADLLMRDMGRLTRIISDASRPVQVVLAGKAHPRDTEGKELIASVIQKIRKHELDHRIVFLEDYEMSIARLMVRGCDVWLNTPRRPYEASGTSGMKAALNGGLNFSILDGWWAEGYDGHNGFAIGRGEMLEPEEQDVADSETLYDLLEHAIVPMFYDMGKTRVPERWVQTMKRSIRTLAPRFSALRMVREYTTSSYLPALEAHRWMVEHGAEQARSTVTFFNRIASVWSDVSVHDVAVHGATGAHVGKVIHVSARVHLGSLTPEDVIVQAVYGHVDSKGEISPAHTTTLQPVSNNGVDWVYEGDYTCEASGMQGCTVRVIPSHPSLVHLTDAHRVAYAQV
ncbi:MAG: alpha-glucan family phosphorylase [bacterium]|nr:alpha-glucan family phosphorylase [bacterium]